MQVQYRNIQEARKLTKDKLAQDQTPDLVSPMQELLKYIKVINARELTTKIQDIQSVQNKGKQLVSGCQELNTIHVGHSYERSGIF